MENAEYGLKTKQNTTLFHLFQIVCFVLKRLGVREKGLIGWLPVLIFFLERSLPVQRGTMLTVCP